ncbi:gastrin/cholecystokinin type B receptor-like [Strongylocentrotus purpuratus]|uniref:G-protein coupled receptors family 1 profile domain-containing protein n=1 Tax=Strongylocentrotus purpuratus TaxID=7668 RepID=A0A7M7N2X0_STRPU|nr:gastrin/cholecystokinin type B receptor-like [Strongylocentrotus purpuratus]
MALTTTESISICYQVILFAVGVPGNLLIILTYCKRQQRTSSGVFIIALALADLGVCLMSPVVIYNYIVYYDYPSNSFCKFRYYTNHGLIYVSRFLTIAVAIERYLAVCKPMSKRIPPKYAAVISALCVPIGYIMTIPIAIAFRTLELPGNRTICYPDTSDPAIKWVLRVSFPITFLGGLLVVVVCYANIYLVIRRQMRLRARMKGGPGKTSGVVSKATEDTATTASSDRGTVHTSFDGRSNQEESEETMSGLHHQGVVLAVVGNKNDESVNVVTQPKSGADTDKPSSSTREQHAQDNDGVDSSEKVPTSFNCCRKTTKSRSKSNSGSMDSTTKMLLIVTVVYFVSFLPQFITIIIPKEAMNLFKTNHKIGYEIFAFVRRLITINHIVNPFVYGFVNTRFRKDCKATMLGLLDKGRRCCGLQSKS